MPVSKSQIKSLLVSPEESWWFGNCLFHNDYNIKKSELIGNNMDNLTEIYLKIHKECVKREWINDKPSDYNNYFYYKMFSVSKHFWPNASENDINDSSSIKWKISNVFSIHRDKLDDFIEMVLLPSLNRTNENTIIFS